jgi:hypothetical protein
LAHGSGLVLDISIKYIAILEFQKNGNPHLHVLVDRFIPHGWIKASWDALGGGRIGDIRLVDIHRISHYLSKYLTKELLLSAPERSRRVTTSRSIHLLEKKVNEVRWRLVPSSIFTCMKSTVQWQSMFITMTKGFSTASLFRWAQAARGRIQR